VIGANALTSGEVHGKLTSFGVGGAVVVELLDDDAGVDDAGVVEAFCLADFVDFLVVVAKAVISPDSESASHS